MREHKTFTKRETNALLSNPYVAAVSSCQIRFTTAFKEVFWNLYTKEHMRPSDIMLRLGFDLSIVGDDRINALPHTLQQQYEKYGEFHEGRHKDPPKLKFQKREIKQIPNNNPPPIEMERMQHELAYMKQELEFIKKTILADREAQQK